MLKASPRVRISILERPETPAEALWRSSRQANDAKDFEPRLAARARRGSAASPLTFGFAPSAEGAARKEWKRLASQLRLRSADLPLGR